MKVIGCTANGRYQLCEACNLNNSPQQCLEFKRKFNAKVKEEYQ